MVESRLSCTIACGSSTPAVGAGVAVAWACGWVALSCRAVRYHWRFSPREKIKSIYLVGSVGAVSESSPLAVLLKVGM